MDSLDRENLEEEIRTLSRQCKCFSRDGPCRACLKADQLNNKLDKLQAEDEVVRDIASWLRRCGDPRWTATDFAAAIERGDWRKKPEKT